jgi:hypothetical protein
MRGIPVPADSTYDCICGDTFADKKEFPDEVHLWNCPTRVRRGGHRPTDNDIAVDIDVWRAVIGALRANGIEANDFAGRDIAAQPEDLEDRDR